MLSIEFQCLHFCLYLRSLNGTTLRSMCYRKVISKSKNYDWRFRKKRVNWWRYSSYACKGNNTVYLVDIAIVIILVPYFICLVSIAIFFVLVIFLFSLLLLKRILTLQLLLLLRVLFPLRRFIPTWNARMTSGISSVSLSREFHLNSRMYNILGKIRDVYMEENDRGRNRVLWVRDCK